MKQNLALIAFAIGAFSPNFYPFLPPVWVTIAGFFCLWLLFSLTRKSWVLAFSLGTVLGVYQACKFDDQLLAGGLDGQIFRASATVINATNRNARSQRLELVVDQLWQPDGGTTVLPYPKKVLLSWYGTENLRPGNRILAEVKLRRPRGLQNPGLFDYQKWLYAEGYGATGYIRELIELEADQAGLNWIDRWRFDKAETISTSEDLAYSGIHQALSLGMGASVDREVWSLFIGTGTVHLMVISGLHVGLVAGIGYLLGFSLGRVISHRLNLNAVRLAIVMSLFFALLYSLISGFDLPAKRAFIMLLALLVPRYFYLRVSPWLSLSAALAVVSVFEPRAVMQTGFWLSFGAVLLIFIGFNGLQSRHFLIGLLRTQSLFFLCFSGMLMWQGVPVPTASFLANLIAVPLVSLLLVPAEMIALMSSLVSDAVAQWLWVICDALVHQLIGVLSYMVALDLPVLIRPADWGLIAGLAAMGALLIWAVPGFRLRFALLLGCSPLLFAPVDQEYFLKLHIFDVGQGTSVLIQHQGWSLLYDTGPKFSDYFDSGEHIIVPSLKQTKIKELDRLILSHSDSDHRGGLEAVLSGVPVKQLDVSKPVDLADSPRLQHGCNKGQSWRHGELVFRYLWPDNAVEYSDNDGSCVLLIESEDIRVLLPGDISANIERKLLVDEHLVKELHLIIVPHHGSKSSSSEAFLRRLSPAIAVVSAGYRNQFNHPHPEIVQRYLDVGSRVLNTADAGAIEIRWASSTSPAEVIRATESKSFWWQK